MDFPDYNPFNVTLYDHQRETMAFILYNKRCFVLDDIGTGKTMSVLSACDFLMFHRKIKRVLVVAPLSVLRITWCDHILKFYPGRRFTVLHGTKQQRLANLSADVEFYIINTDGIKLLEKEIAAKKFDMIVIDESTTYSSHSSARTKCAWRVARKIPSVLCLTGNPIPNDTIQSYAQAKLVDFDKIQFFTKYRDILKIKLDMYSYIDRDNAVAIAHSVLQPSIRHKMEDCLDLPPITYQFLETKLSKEQEKHYKLMEKEYITWLDSGEAVTAANAAVKLTKLMQISVGILINKDGDASVIDNKPRLDALKLVVGQTSKIIIFANFTKSINNLLEAFPGSEKIDGSVSGNKRYDIMTRFQEGDLKILICQPAAISHGVTLTASNTIVWWGPCFSNEHFQQCNGRIRRPGQDRPQLIIKMQGTKVEKRIYQALERKQFISRALLDFNLSDEEVEQKEQMELHSNEEIIAKALEAGGEVLRQITVEN